MDNTKSSIAKEKIRPPIISTVVWGYLFYKIMPLVIAANISLLSFKQLPILDYTYLLYLFVSVLTIPIALLMMWHFHLRQEYSKAATCRMAPIFILLGISMIAAIQSGILGLVTMKKA